MGKKYQREYQVPYYESDLTGKMKLASLFNVALQVSGEQSAALERSDDYVKMLGVTWIVTEYQVTLERLPYFNERIVIETEALSFNKFFCYRRFTIKDFSGNVLGVIDSTWCLLDLATRKLTSIKTEIIAPYMAQKVKTIQKTQKIKAPEQFLEKCYPVRFSDLDTNQHVNNAKYIGWLLDSLDYDFLIQHEPVKLHLKYIKEVQYGSTITSRVERVDFLSYHEIVTDTLNAQAEIEWRYDEV
ncbi:MAG: acyl-[acyl-carrier-protein] thioesterase [Streptococcaceae bacterium]|jgi:medium-chain acyl-[acyl-carrier-protein] hydrolase|nr:acyl-[acyl-carrier-protein] thioesterase [Streptococcaceae bacterium]